MVWRHSKCQNHSEVVDHMIPILFEYNATNFTTHGLGDLIDCITCETSCNDEGEYEMSFSYPKDSELFPELTIGRLVLVKANPWQQNQIFRIYGYEKGIGGTIKINCEHISYDLNRIPVKKFKAAENDTQSAVLQKMITNVVPIVGFDISTFTFYSDVTDKVQRTEGYYELETPSSVRATILDGDDSIKGMFGGNLVLDNFNVKLLKSGSEEGGMDRGTLIEYGADLIDLTQEENISEMYTGVLPYYRYTPSGSEDEVCVYGSVQYASGTFQNHRIYPLDITEFFPNQAENTSPSISDIESKGRDWMAAEDGFGEPEVNLTLSYASLGQDVRLHDQVTVRFVKMGIDVASKVTSYKYDVLLEKMLEIEVGKTKKTILFSLEDASRLKKGLLPPKRIQSKSLTSDKYADGSVQSAAIGSGSVGTSKIANNAVKEEKIDTSAVTVNKIADGAVQSVKLADLSVSERKIVNEAVALGKLSSGVQATLADLIVAKEVYATVIYARKSVSCSTLIVSGHQYVYDGGGWVFTDGNGNTRRFYGLRLAGT